MLLNMQCTYTHTHNFAVGNKFNVDNVFLTLEARGLFPLGIIQISKQASQVASIMRLHVTSPSL